MRCFGWLFLLLIVCLPQRSAAEPLGRNDIIELTLAHNLAIQTAALDVRSAQAQIQQAWGGVLPKVNLEAGWNKSDSYQTRAFSDIFGSAFGPLFETVRELSENDPNVATFNPTFGDGGTAAIESYNVRITVNQLLFSMQAIPALNASFLALDAAQHRFNATGQMVLLNVLQAYYSILSAREFVALSRQSVTTLESHLSRVNILVNGGVGTQADILNVQTRLEESRRAELEAEKNYQLALQRLKFSIGLEAGDELILASSPLPDRRTLFVPDAGQLETYVQSALEKRPDYLALVKTKYLLENNVDIQAAAYWPSIYFTGYYGYADDAGFRFDDRNVEWAVGINGTWPIFDGFQREAQVTQAVIEVERTEKNMESLRQQITLDILDAIYSLRVAVQTIERAERALDFANRTLAIRQAEYEAGAATNQDVLDAQLAVEEAQASLLSSRQDYFSGLVRWHYAMGDVLEVRGTQAS